MFYLLVASLLWGTSFIAGKYAEEFASPELVVLLRFLIASLFIAHIAIKHLRKLDKKLIIQLLFVAFLTYPLTFLLQFIGLQYTNASNAVTMLGIEPLIVVLAGHFFFKEKATYLQIAMALLAFLGVLLVMGKPDLSNDNFIGCAIVFSSTLVIAVWLRMAKNLMTILPKGAYTPVTLLLGFLLTIPCVLLINQDWSIHVSHTGIASVVYLGIGCSLLASWAWNKGLSMSTANDTGIFLALEPVFGVLFGIALLGDRPGFYAGVGIILVLSAVFISIVSANKNS